MSEEFIIDKDNQEMFEVFCNQHPVEAFDLNPVAFYEYAKKRIPGVTIEQIQITIDEYREHGD